MFNALLKFFFKKGFKLTLKCVFVFIEIVLKCWVENFVKFNLVAQNYVSLGVKTYAEMPRFNPSPINASFNIISPLLGFQCVLFLPTKRQYLTIESPVIYLRCKCCQRPSLLSSSSSRNSRRNWTFTRFAFPSRVPERSDSFPNGINRISTINI